MTDKNIALAEGRENSVAEVATAPRDHQINLSVTEDEWQQIEAHCERLKPHFPNRRIVPVALGAYDLVKRGLGTVAA